MKLKHMLDATIKKEARCLSNDLREEADAWHAVLVALRNVYRVRQRSATKHLTFQ